MKEIHWVLIILTIIIGLSLFGVAGYLYSTKSSNNDIYVYTDKSSYDTGENVIITIENRGNTKYYFPDAAKRYYIDKYDGGQWRRYHTIRGDLDAAAVLTPFNPGEKLVDAWIADSSGQFRVRVRMYTDDPIEEVIFTSEIFVISK